jgi:Kef-type K+ transport system membrane component KefB
MPVFPLLAAAGPSDVPGVLIALVAIFLATKLLGELAQRFGQPSVLGELLAGVILGGSVLGIVNPSDPVIHVLAELGVIILLFAIGLETDLRSLTKVGSTALTVAIVGVVLPMSLGFVSARALGLATIPALVCGAALCATSIGISARVLSDLGVLETREGQVVLGAAVIDDVIGLIILAVVAGLADGASVSLLGVSRIAGVAIGFVVLAILVGGAIAPPAFRIIERIKSAGALGLFGLAFAFVLSWLAARSGSAMIVGAFAAGLVLYRVPQKHEIEHAATRLGHFFVPVFFASVGAAVDLRALADPSALLTGAVLILVGVIGKVAAGYAPWWFRGNKLLVGVAMVPRGEVGLIFAQMGLTSGAIDAKLYGALMLMVLATTFVVPPALARIAPSRAGAPDDLPGEGGIDDLVAGESRRSPEVVKADLMKDEKREIL